MDTLSKLVKIIKVEAQQLEFIETCYKQGLCTAGEAYDKTIDLLVTTDKIWKDVLNKKAYEDNKYQAKAN